MPSVTFFFSPIPSKCQITTKPAASTWATLRQPSHPIHTITALVPRTPTHTTRTNTATPTNNSIIPASMRNARSPNTPIATGPSAHSPWALEGKPMLRQKAKPTWRLTTTFRPVGSGKTALMLALCQRLRDQYSIAAVTNDIFTKEDTEFLVRNKALPEERIKAIETGGCPHAVSRIRIRIRRSKNSLSYLVGYPVWMNFRFFARAVLRWFFDWLTVKNCCREDVSANLNALEVLHAKFDTQLLLIESGGDNLAANYRYLNNLFECTLKLIAKFYFC